MMPTPAQPPDSAEQARAVPYSLRASVAATCNMACHYCPRFTSMEDYTPDKYRNRGITHDHYMPIFTGLLRVLRFSQVSLTGVEPTINHTLARLPPKPGP